MQDQMVNVSKEMETENKRENGIIFNVCYLQERYFKYIYKDFSF